MWNSRSPGVATAWRGPATISWNGCSSAGRGAPNRRSQTSEPNAMMQDRCSSGSRNPTERSRAARSPQSVRTAVSAAAPGATVTTRKIAARVSGAATGCGWRRPPVAGRRAAGQSFQAGSSTSARSREFGRAVADALGDRSQRSPRTASTRHVSVVSMPSRCRAGGFRSSRHSLKMLWLCIVQFGTGRDRSGRLRPSIS